MESTTKQTEEKIHVLIIGAGRSGMLATRHISALSKCSITVVEAKSEVGGLWAYDELNAHHSKAEEAKRSDNYYRLYNCFQGSIYPNVITNFPKHFDSCKDFTMDDFNPKLPDFLSIKEYNSYLNAYWEHFDLKKHVAFNTLVKSVRPYENLSAEERSAIGDLPARTFVVTTVDAKGDSLLKNQKVAMYDYVIAASGPHVKPYIPPVSGISNFKGFVLHSKDFREPDDLVYQDKTILLLGGSYSAIDMVVQFFHNPVKGRQNIKKMIMCSNDLSLLEKSTDFKSLQDEGALLAKKGWIRDFTEDSAVFTDGTSEKIDVVMYCTGYAATFPYIDPADKILEFGGEENREKFFGPLYKRCVSIRQPRLFFPGFIDDTTFDHYINEMQALLIKHCIEGTVKLPSVEEMMTEYEQDIEEVRASSKNGSLLSFFRLESLRIDLPYLDGLKKMMQHLYPCGEEKWKKYFERLLSMRAKCLELFSSGDLLRYKSYDFSGMYPEEVKNSTDFI